MEPREQDIHQNDLPRQIVLLGKQLQNIVFHIASISSYTLYLYDAWRASIYLLTESSLF